MVFIVPQPHKCTKCGNEEELSPHIASFNLILGSDIFCHKCLSEFLRGNVGVMKSTNNFAGDGSEYDKAKKMRSHQVCVGGDTPYNLK